MFKLTIVLFFDLVCETNLLQIMKFKQLEEEKEQHEGIFAMYTQVI